MRQTVSGDFCAEAVNRMEITRQHSKECIIEENSLNILQTKMEHGPVDNIFPVCSEPIIAALLAQQLPLLPKFSGERNDGDMETFQDWLEQFEMIANICGRSPQAKLVNLVTRLQGQAYAFFVPVQFSRRLVMCYWLQNYRKGLPQFNYRLFRAVSFMIGSKKLENQ